MGGSESTTDVVLVSVVSTLEILNYLFEATIPKATLNWLSIILYPVHVLSRSTE
jgi:C4-dicarboxylate transporter